MESGCPNGQEEEKGDGAWDKVINRFLFLGPFFLALDGRGLR